MRLSHLRALEAEAVRILREVAAECERPVLLFSGGKDSIALLRLAVKAFRPARLPFPILHVDTGHNFPEIIEFRDRLVEALGETLIVAKVQDRIDQGLLTDETGPGASRNRLQIPVLLEAIATHRFDAAIGGARRDEEKARAKERVFSHRDRHGQWDPKNQRPELWSLYHGKLRRGEHLRVFPLSNWTELDVWEYIAAEEIEVPELYTARIRTVFERSGLLYCPAPFVHRLPSETLFETKARFRTVGDMTCTCAVRSHAETLEEIIAEVRSSRITERGATRADDRMSDAAMEDRKREGYF